MPNILDRDRMIRKTRQKELIPAIYNLSCPARIVPKLRIWKNVKLTIFENTAALAFTVSQKFTSAAFRIHWPFSENGRNGQNRVFATKKLSLFNERGNVKRKAGTQI